MKARRAAGNVTPLCPSAATDDRYITLLVPEIGSSMTALETSEVLVTVPITELGDGTKIAMIEDPDGNIVEFA